MANDPNTIQYVIQEDGFWYVASKDRTPGVPEITVSAKGVANGLSTEYNDGYDFGPDSYNPSVTTGVPLTQTSGLQEAYNYLSTFPDSSYNNDGVIMLIGEAGGRVNFVINKEIQLGATSSSWVTAGRLGTSIIPSSTFSDSYLFNLSAASISFENISFQGGTSSIGYLENTNAVSEGTFDYHFTKCYFGSSPFNIFNFNWNSNSRAIFIDSQLALSGTSGSLGTWGSNGAYNNSPIIFIGCDFSIPSGFGFNADAGSPVFIGCYQHGASSTYGSLMNITNSTSMVGLTMIGHNIMDSSTVFNFSNTNANSIQRASIYGGSYQQKWTAGTYNGSFSELYTDSQELISEIGISTPSVPSSGTAQSNTNPYAVKVYVNGGALTEIQITIGSTTYKVYSNSTASAVYEGFTLPAGASITLTYSTAPTWSWLPE